MSRVTRKMPSIKNVSAGSTASLSLPVGHTYDKLTLAYTGTAVTRAMFKNIDLRVNGKTIVEYKDANELDLINDYYGRSDTAGFITMHFFRPELLEKYRRLTALGTNDVGTLDLQFDIDGTAPGDLAMIAYAVQSDPQPLGAFVKVRAFPVTFATSGKQDIDSLPQGPRIMAAHFIKSDITDIDVDVNSFKAFEASKAVAEVFQREHGRVPQTASATHVDFCLEGDIAQSLVTDPQLVKDLRFRPTLGTSGSVRAVVEYLDGFNGL